MNFNGYFIEFLTGLTERLLVPVFLQDIKPYYPMNFDWQAFDSIVIIHIRDQAVEKRLALPAAGGMRLAPETDKTQSHKKAIYGGTNPAVRVHALLGAVS